MDFPKYRKWGEYHWAEFEKAGSDIQRHALRIKDWVKEKDVLDIGCGDGLYVWLLGCKGIDPDEVGIRYAKKRGLPCEVGSIYDLSQQGRFEAALVADTLCWLDEPEKGVSELEKVTDKVYITSHLRDYEKICHEWTVEELNGMFSKYGWKPESVEVPEDLGRIYAIYKHDI